MKYVLITLLVLTQVFSLVPSVFAQEEVSYIETAKESVLEDTSLSDAGQNDEASIEKAGEEVLPEELLETDPNEAFTSSSSTPPTTSEPPHIPKSNLNLFQIDEKSGAFTYGYPLTLPIGPNSHTPELSLNYNSQTKNNTNWTGYGWNLSLAYIERYNKTGIEKMYVDNHFTSSLGGELVHIGNNHYAHRDERGDFLDYHFVNDAWVVTTKDGSIYTFGQTSNERQSDPFDSSKTFRWMVTSIVDSNENQITFSYTKDAGQIYPDTITYALYEVEFLWENRPDNMKSAASGFLYTNNQRLSKIQIKTSGQVHRSYNLEYIPGDNNTRSMLGSIQETAGNVTMPKIEFEYSVSTHNWVEDTSWEHDIDESLYRAGFGHLPNVLIDFTGDGYVDLFSPFAFGNYYGVNRVHDTIDSWDIVPPSSWAAPPINVNYWGEQQYFDINGDLFVDIAKPLNLQIIYNDTVDSFDSPFFYTYLPRPVNVTASDPSYRRLADLNGDGLQDLLWAFFSGPNYVIGAFSNQGDAWEEDTSWTMHANHRFSGATGPTGASVIDLNGDGLTDLLNSGWVGSGGPSYDGLNNGKSEWEVFNWQGVGELNNASTYALTDINGDGLTDYYRKYTTNQQPNQTHINNGVSSFALIGANMPPQDPCCNPSAKRLADMNADGLIDILELHYYESNGGFPVFDSHIYIKEGDVPDLLTHITTPQSGTVNIEYTPSTHYRDSSGGLLNPKLPMILQTVSKLTFDPIQGDSWETHYEYADGHYWWEEAAIRDRKFAGFASITTTHHDNTSTTTYYHQGNTSNTVQGEYNDRRSKIGLPYRSEVRDHNGTLLQSSITKWDHHDLGQGREFVFSTDEVVMLGADHSATSYDYDLSNGNLAQISHWGSVSANNDGTYTDQGGDKRFERFSYTTNPTRVSLHQHWKASDSAVTRYFYDNLSFGNASKGNLTRQRHQIQGGWLTTQYTHDQFGNVLSTTDPNGNTSYTQFDQWGIFPVQVVNALGHETNYSYDYHISQPVEIDGPNTLSTYSYDGLGRPLAEYINNQEIRTYQYNDAASPRSISMDTIQDPSPTSVTVTYLDGFDRTIQTRSKDTNRYIVIDTSYDHAGRVATTTLPYASSGPSYLTLAPNPAITINTSYDALDRPQSINNIVGSTAYTYQGLDTIVTNPNDAEKELHYDYFGNLKKVIEHNQGQQYQTIYWYDFQNNLTKIKDNNDNIREFTYDKVGRKIQQTDLRHQNDTSFKDMHFAYDNNGNLISQTNQDGSIITYTYDALNRIVTSNQGETYSYDSCHVGSLCQVTTPDITTSYSYDARGRVTQVDRDIQNQTYTITTDYDTASNPLTVSYPHGDTISYQYNELAQAIAAQSQLHGLLAEAQYHVSGQPSLISYANGVVTELAYGNLYRLVERHTQSYQILSYTYDPVGNITQIIDQSVSPSTGTYTYTYDDLNRLTEVVAPSTSYTYQYDAIGNILTATVGQNTQLYQYNQAPYTTPHAATSFNGNALTYDDNGNLIQDSTHTHTYNPYNRLTSSTTLGATTNYTYDHTGTRISKGDTISPFTNYREKNSIPTLEVSLGNILIASIENTPTFIHQDHLASTNVVTDVQGTLAERITYHPFGQEDIVQINNAQQADRTFTGHLKDDETGLQYMEARYYSPATRRFQSLDPAIHLLGDDERFKERYKRTQEIFLADPQQLNAYSYVRNNPIVITDETGEIAPLVAGILLGSIIGGHGLILYGAINNNADVVEVGFAMNDIGVSGGSMVGPKQGPLKPLTGNFGTQTQNPALTASRSTQQGPGIRISQDRYRHVLDAHTQKGADYQNRIAQGRPVSRFNKGENIVELINGAANHQRVESRGRYTITYDAGRNIGVDGLTGKQTSTVTVITKKNGDLVTAHPGNPSQRGRQRDKGSN